MFCQSKTDCFNKINIKTNKLAYYVGINQQSRHTN